MGDLKTPNFSSDINWPLACKRQICQRMNFKAPEALQACWISTNDLRNSCSYEQGVNPRRNISIGVVLLFMTCSYKPSDQFRFIYNVPEYHSFSVIFFAFKKQRETKKANLVRWTKEIRKGTAFFLSFQNVTEWKRIEAHKIPPVIALWYHTRTKFFLPFKVILMTYSPYKRGFHLCNF